MYLERKDLPVVQPILHATFPSYAGTNIQILPASAAPKELRSYWNGGSKDSFAFYRLDTGESIAVHSNHPYFEPDQPSTLAELPSNVVLVQHTIFCGKDLGLALYGNLAPMLPVPTETVSHDQKIVLVATRSLKNSYGGRTGIRKEEAVAETGISAERYDMAYRECIAAGFLNSTGAITVKGKNIAGMTNLRALRLEGYKGRYGF